MDKLEKALQKARTQRRLDLGPAPRTPHAPQQLPPGTVGLDEAVLDQHRIFAHKTRSAEADLIRLLRTQVLQALGKAECKTLAITSPNYGDGKTTIAINLALSIALDLNQTVLLADLDIRKPCVSKYLGLTPKAGLTDHLSDGTPIPECLLRLPFERMSILPSGQIFDNSSEILGSPQMTALAEELKTRYPDRLIIYDMPPILAQDDPLAFLPNVDAVLLVVREGMTRAPDVKRCLNILKGRAVIGAVLNNSLAPTHNDLAKRSFLQKLF